MNTTNNNNLINRMVNTLISAYRIHPNTMIDRNSSYQKLTCHKEVEDWILRSLLNPDEQLAECILPILVDRFEEYLKSCELFHDQ